ncbi:MAG TPA: RNA polymerase sigma factor [Solirubrobacteraceae bacterium]|jgi:RNA polymerase sigma factor (sigma-70 family)|nr:RNA polymerase sigma factor [Solirubrobacteraceae bacterium]
MSADERSLYERIAAGDDAAFRTLIRPHQQLLSKFVRRRLAGDTPTTEDVLQETYLAAYRAVVAGARPDHVRSWLFTIARNHASNVRRSRRPATPLDESAAAAGASCPARAAEQREWMAGLMSAITGLPVRQRTALVEHVFEGRSYEEIAQRQHTTVGAVKTLMHRARQGLAQSAEWRSTYLPGMAWISRVVPHRTHAVALGKLGAKSALVGQALAAVVLATSALVVVQAIQVPPVRASSVRLTVNAHPRPRALPPRRHTTGRGRAGSPGPRRVRREAARAVHQCVTGHKLSRRLGVRGLAYAREHLSTELREYTDCEQLIFAAELRAAKRRHRHLRRTHRQHAGRRGGHP